MNAPTTQPATAWTSGLRQWLRDLAASAGFDAAGVAPVASANPQPDEEHLDAARFAAWIEAGRAGEMEYLKRRDGDDFKPFTQDDYNEYVDGMPRYDGVRTFLKSRDIELPEGSPDDAADAETIDGIGNRKNDLVLQIIKTDGVESDGDSAVRTRRGLK